MNSISYPRLVPSFAHQKWGYISKELSQKPLKVAAIAIAFFGVLSFSIYYIRRQLFSRHIESAPSPSVPGKDPHALQTMSKMKQSLAKEKLIYKVMRNGNFDKINFVDCLFKTLFREDEIQVCTFAEETKIFTLDYVGPKIVNLQFPEAVKKKIPALLQGVIALLFSPQIQIAQQLQGQLIKEQEGVKISLHNKGIFLVKTLGYTGYLKSILIRENPPDNETLVIETEHNIRFVSQKTGTLSHQTLADILESSFFLPQSQKTSKRA